MKKVLVSFLILTSLSSIAQNWHMVWNDEFDYTGLPDATKWSFDTEGNNWDWGNSEEQNYTPADRNNVWVDGKNLVIEAREEQYTWPGDNQTKDYTSGRIVTAGKGDWLYGRVEVRALLPTGTGVWPAIWMLPTDWEYGDWPASGEMDIMENVGYDPDRLHCNTHTKAYNHSIGTNKGNNILISSPSVNWHVYRLEWDAETVSYFCDDTPVFSFKNEHSGFEAWPFDKRFHLILNVAVGGSWGGTNGIDNTIFPQRMLVDYVRVYQDQPTEQSPYGGTPVAIPGSIEAEHYDLGDASTAYSDATPGNEGGVFRTDQVDIELCKNGGYNVAWIADNEWMEYTVNVGEKGNYDLTLHTASQTTGGLVRLEVDGVDASGYIQLPATGDWQTWLTTTKTIALEAGQHLLRFVVGKGGFNFDKMVFSPTLHGGFLRTSGQNIIDGMGNPIVLRGIGTGNWMIQEGYMMQATDETSTHSSFRNKLVQTMGEARANEFYDKWLSTQLTRTDIDSMKRWGFNSVRVAMHYIWFTLPVEKEPVAGQNTWIDKGFTLIDSLLSWCQANQMYLVLDMHGTPGGQGKDANISDYNPALPSLWESEDNKKKLVALWTRLAQRYATQPWVGGYDLINETNWDFENSGNKNGCACSKNTPLIDMHKRIIDAIRTVDKKHIVFVSGNCWGNNYGGMDSLMSHDNNLAITFHKYWNHNDEASIKGLLDLRAATNCPLWMSESGENSNEWFADAVALLERNNIGWSWWPIKKPGINNVLKVTPNPDYTKMIESWEGNGTIGADDAYKAVMQFAENHLTQNCTVARDVIYALMNAPFSSQTKPFARNTTNQVIFATDYDLGRNQYAYFDSVVANYQANTSTFTAWNERWFYRNDGVDIVECTDDISSGYAVGFIKAGEWMNYTLDIPATATYNIILRTSSTGTGSARILIDGVDASGIVATPNTTSWETYQSTTVPTISISKGTHTIKIQAEAGNYNINYFVVENAANPYRTQSIALKKGQNIVSLYVTPTHALVAQVFPHAMEVKTTSIFYRSGQEAFKNSLTTIVGGQAYVVFNSIDETLLIPGALVSQPATTALSPGWNLVGVPSEKALPVSLLPTSVDAARNTKAAYIKDGAQNTLIQLSPGEGYFIKTKKDPVISWE